MARDRRARGRPRGIEIKNGEQLRYDLARIGDRPTVAQRLQMAIQEDEQRAARRYPYLPQASTVWQWLKGRPVAWPGHALRDLARFIEDQTALPCDRDVWIHPPATALHVCNAPRRPSLAFRGRDAELADLKALLAGSDESAGSVVLAGLPGVGKTELALQVAYALAADAGGSRAPTFPRGIFWLDAQNPDLTAAWDHIARKCLEISGDTTAARVAEAIRRIEGSPEPSLLILDNAFLGKDERWETGHGKPFPLPEGPQIRLLVTTRNEYFGGSAFHQRELGVLSKAASRELLLELSSRDPLRDAERMDGLDELLDVLNGHALAIEVSGVFLRRNGSETPRSFLSRMRQGERFEQDARQTGYAVQKSDPRATIQGAFEALWSSLDAETQGWWSLASQFAPSPARVELAESAGLSMRALAALRDFHLIDWDASGKRWLMHRLTREFGEGATRLEQRPAVRKAFVLGAAAQAARDVRAYRLDAAHFDVAVEVAPEVLEPDAELRLLLAIGPALIGAHGASEKPRRLYQRAIELADGAKQHEQVILALEGIWNASLLMGDLARADEFAGRIEELARKHESPCYWVLAYRARGENAYYEGRVVEACAWLDQGVEVCRNSAREELRAIVDPGVLLIARAGLAHTMAGAPDRGLQLSADAVELASELGQSPSLILALLQRASVHRLRRELDETLRYSLQAGAIGAVRKLPFMQMTCVFSESWIRIVLDPVANAGALAAMLESIEQSAQLQLRQLRGLHMYGLADAYHCLGRRAEGLEAVEEGLRNAQLVGAHEPELWRLRGALVDSPEERVRSLTRAVEVALEKGSRWFALRAATDLCAAVEPALRAAARERLRDIYSSFSEGFELPDLIRARAALESPAPDAS